MSAELPPDPAVPRTASIMNRIVASSLRQRFLVGLMSLLLVGGGRGRNFGRSGRFICDWRARRSGCNGRWLLWFGGGLFLGDVRHTGRYMQVLQECGLEDLRRRAESVPSLLIGIISLGFAYPAHVTARKPAPAGGQGGGAGRWRCAASTMRHRQNAPFYPPAPPPCFLALFRFGLSSSGGFFAPSDLMMRLPLPSDGNGTLA